MNFAGGKSCFYRDKVIQSIACFCRTDAGVHAARTFATVDLEPRANGFYYDPKVITVRLNELLARARLDIRYEFDRR